ncbi:MAG: glutathione S-transferase [Pseudomonadota bacterium]
MRLIGMLDSPYVRRVAISLDLLGIAFQHESISVFSTFAQFSAINPVVKAPSLVCDDGVVLMDSSLILQFVEASAGRSLWSAPPALLAHEFRAVGLALAACEKSAQIVYERNLRPKEAQHEPWVERVSGQLLAAYDALEQQVLCDPAVFADPAKQPALSAAVAWGFTQAMLPALVPAANHPGLVALAHRLEQTAPFLKYPAAGPGVSGQLIARRDAGRA